MAQSSPAPEYEDLRLLIEGTGGQYRASVVESPAGETASPETVQWSLPAKQPEKESELRRVGTSLFDAFFTGQVRELYRESCALTSARLKGLRLKLLIDAPELSAAPWELMFDGRNRRYLGLSSKTPIVRHPKIPQAVEPLIVQPPLRVLGLIANPLDPSLPPLDVERERSLIEKALAEASEAGLVELKWLPRGTWEELQQAMWQGWHVFHFCGHGDYDGQAGAGYLVFENGEGRAHRLAAAQLGLLLREQGDVRLAILNSCKGAVGDSASSSSLAVALVRAGLGGVVSMQNPISDHAALTFARVLYLGIASGLPVEAALGSARVAMTLEHVAPIEWWTPVLHMRSREGTLFTVPTPPVASHPKIRGTEYLDRDLDRLLEEGLTRRRRLRRVLLSLVFAPVPLLAFLIATPVSSDSIRAEVQVSGATLALSSQRELFGERPRLQAFSASGFSQLSVPGFTFPLRPGPGQEAVMHAEATDTGSWISLEPWTLPAGAVVTWDHPRGANTGEYLVSLTTEVGRRHPVGLVNRIRLSRLGSARELHDYADTSTLELVSAARPLELTLQFRQPGRFTTPRLPVASVQLLRKGFGDDGPITEPTVLSAQLRFAGRDTVLNATPLELRGLHNASVDRLRLIDSGIAFSLSGSVTHITIGGRPVEFPSRLRWRIRERPLDLVAGALAYVLILLTALISWRTSHVSRPRSK